jgi:phage terminase large subunit
MNEPVADLPEWCEPFFAPARYKVAHGGRGSGKSWAFARMLVIRAVQGPVRVLCARELQNSIQDSVHQLLVDQINALGLSGCFHILESKITSMTGSEFLFKGLRGMKNNAQAIKSLEGVDICWIEEGQTISAASFETLTPTIRKPGAEIWITMNPDQDTDPVYQLIKNPPEGSIIRRVNWQDNPWFEQTSLPEEREWMQRTDPDAYAHVWEGECRQNSDAQVLRGKYVVDTFKVLPDWDGPYQGADWGFSTDPTAFVRCWIGGRKLYIEAEAYGVGVEIDALPALFDAAHPQARQSITRADNARPETISYMQRHGYTRLVAADKWPGSVEDGVAFLRSFEQIVIHPNCKHTAEEARLYSYKTDRLTGDVLPTLVDKNNHAIDSIRYALAPLIRKRAPGLHTMTNIRGL